MSIIIFFVIAFIVTFLLSEKQISNKLGSILFAFVFGTIASLLLTFILCLFVGAANITTSPHSQKIISVEKIILKGNEYYSICSDKGNNNFEIINMPISSAVIVERNNDSMQMEWMQKESQSVSKLWFPFMTIPIQTYDYKIIIPVWSIQRKVTL